MADGHCILVKRYNSDLSCCGVVLDSENGIVLTVASLFADLLPQTKEQRLFSADCRILSQDDLLGTSASGGQIAVEVVVRRSREQEFTTLPGCVVLLWRDEGLQRISERIFPTSEWKFESPTHTSMAGEIANEQQNDVNRSLLSDFVLIRVENLKKYLSWKQLNLSTLRKSESPSIGDVVFVVGTPFGCECPHVFYNSISKGIISNLVGADNELIITDARCVPGCEGCTLYIQNSQAGLTKRNSLPHGIVLVPFCWRNGEWIGITVACSLAYLLQNLRKLLVKQFIGIPPHLQVLLGVFNPKAKLYHQPVVVDGEVERDNQDRGLSVIRFDPCNLRSGRILEMAFASVIIVQVGRTWGSGIVIDTDKGLVATCSHVIRGHEDSTVVTDNKDSAQSVRRMMPDRVFCALPNGTCRMAQVLYDAKEDSPLDLALLKIQPHPSMRSLKPRLGTDIAEVKSHNLSNHLYGKGEEVFVVGFPVFARHQHAQPSVVSGVISNIVFADNQAVLLQSSAAVHCGASGGALVSMVTGELLGMVTSHTKDAHLSSAFPHVNYSIPVDLIYKVVSAVQSGDVEEGLQALVSNQVESIWKLESTVRECPQIKSKL